MENNNNKHLLYAGLAIIVVIAVALAVPHFKSRTVSAPEVAPATVAATTQAPTMSADARLAAWNENFQTYNGKLVVFADDCLATPLTQNQPKGATILLMNNSDTPHTIMVDTSSYAIGARHWRTTMLDTAGTVTIGCDARAAAATVIVK